MIQFLFWVVVAMFVGGCCLCLHIGYRFGLEDRADRAAHQPWYPPGTPLTEIFPDLADAEWDRLLEQTRAEGKERMLRDTGELAKLYGRPYPGELTGTGELRQLAYAGDLAALEADTAAFIASLEEGDAAA